MRVAGAVSLAFVVLTACSGAPSAPSSSSATVPASPRTTAANSTTAAPPPVLRRVVLYGDGLLDGHGLADAESLPVLISQARPDLQILDMGLGQERAAQVLERIRDAKTAHASDIVVWAGSYDAAQGLGPQDVAANVGHMLDALSAEHVLVLLPLDVRSGTDAPAYAAPVRAVAAAHGAQPVDAGPTIAARQSGPAVDGNMNLSAAADSALARMLAGSLPHGSGIPAQVKHSVLLLGDSLANGSGLPDPQALPADLARSRPDLDVIDEAVGGSTTADLLSRLRAYHLVHADEVVIWIGTSDADAAVRLDAFRTQLGSLVDAFAPGKVVLVTPAPDFSRDPTAVTPYADATRSLAGSRGLPLVDAGAMVSAGDYLDDRMHLNAAAEERVTAALSATI